MKNLIVMNVLLFILIGCFESSDVTAPRFVPQSPPDSLDEKGIGAHPENAIYLEWIEPASAEDEVIQGYYIYRGKLIDQEYKFEQVDRVERNGSYVESSDSYIDYNVNLDTTYYYYLRSYNDYTVGKETSDTVLYKLVNKPILTEPAGEITNQIPLFAFRFPVTSITQIDYYYYRLYYAEEGKYTIKYFVKKHRFDYGRTQYYVYLNNNDSETTILYNDLWKNIQGQSYLEKGNYRWRVDAVSVGLGGAPETEGSESDWAYFTVK